jgi:hypothetical protein
MTSDQRATTVDQLAAQQRPDGSWGPQATPTARIVTTILAARSLQEAGLASESSLARALDFLADVAVVGGGASIAGARESVLSCYTGMLARLFVRADRTDDARPLLDWIVRYQPVDFGGRSYLEPARPTWGAYLRTRYGGCMSSTTCLLGLVPTVSALVAARRAGLEVDGAAHEAALRRLLTDRRVLFGRSGEVMPLAGRTKRDPAGTRWLAPAFPLDYVVDLIELVDLALGVGVPLESMRESIAQIASWRLPSGGWPMLARRSLAIAYRPEPVDRRRPSELITRRVAALGLRDLA